METQVIITLVILVVLLLWERFSGTERDNQFGGRGEKPCGPKPIPTPRAK